MSSRMVSVATCSALALLLAGCGAGNNTAAKTTAASTAPGTTTTATTTPTSTTGKTGTGTTSAGSTPSSVGGPLGGATTPGTTTSTPATPLTPTPTTSPTPPVTTSSPAPTASPTPPATPANPNAALAQKILAGSTVKLGDAGTDVANLQDALRDCGFDPGATDGSFGPNTQVAVVAFQEANGLTPDGIVGAQTRDAIAAYLNSGATPTSYKGTANGTGLWLGNWTETNAASGSTMGLGAGSLRMILTRDAKGNVTGAVKVVGGTAGVGDPPVVYEITQGTCDSSGNVNFYCDDSVSTGSYPITTLQFVGKIKTGSTDSINGAYYVTGAAYPGNAGTFDITR